jgi:iron complex transport system substrate-binding protein
MMIHYKIAAGFAIALGVWLLSHLSLDARLLSPIAPLNSTVAAGAFPKRLHNPLGHEQVLQQAPARIASGILAADEIFAILRAKNRLVAVTDIADDPGISNVAHFYSTDVVRSEADTEVLLATAPDMVVVAAYSDAATVRLLLSTNVPVLRIPEFTSFADIKRNTMTLASAIGEEERGAEVLARMQQRLDARGECRQRPAQTARSVLQPQRLCCRHRHLDR